MTYLQVKPVDPARTVKKSNLGRNALVLVIVCAILSIAGSLWLGSTIARVEAEFGPTLLETPDPYRSVALAVLASQVVCAFGGVTALIRGGNQYQSSGAGKSERFSFGVVRCCAVGFIYGIHARIAVCCRVSNCVWKLRVDQSNVRGYKVGLQIALRASAPATLKSM